MGTFWYKWEQIWIWLNSWIYAAASWYQFKLKDNYICCIFCSESIAIFVYIFGAAKKQYDPSSYLTYSQNVQKHPKTDKLPMMINDTELLTKDAKNPSYKNTPKMVNNLTIVGLRKFCAGHGYRKSSLWSLRLSSSSGGINFYMEIGSAARGGWAGWGMQCSAMRSKLFKFSSQLLPHTGISLQHFSCRGGRGMGGRGRWLYTFEYQPGQLMSSAWSILVFIARSKQVSCWQSKD